MSVSASYLFSGVFAGLLEGAGVYLVDRKVGVRAYRWWYDLTHKHPLPPDEHRGFVFNRQANARFTTATLVSVVQNGLAFELGMAHPFSAMMTILVEVPVLMGGFYLGPFVQRMWQKKDPLLEVVDKLESGETTVAAEMRRATGHVAGTLRETLAMPEPKAPEPPVVKAAEPPPPPPPAEPDPAEALRSYTKRQR